MCGIVGYTGEGPAVPVLLSGLYKLEYRGYDSAGVALLEQDALKVIKTKGRIKSLEALVKKEGNLTATCGIGHTRWATHGEPSDLNAHPHVSQNGRVALVHNGIIENYLELRSMLSDLGYTIKTQTDTEVVAHLFEHCFKGDVVSALIETVKYLHGSFALAVISADKPGELVCTRRDNPLIVGIGQGENLIGSDIPAIIGSTKKYMILNDNEVARVTPRGVQVYNLMGETVEKEVLEVQWDMAAAEKGGYEHFMIKEILEQPRAIRDTLASRLKNWLPNLSAYGMDRDLFAGLNMIHIVACGSALHAGLVGKAVIERLARIPVICTIASEFRYQNPIIGPKDLCIVISQSGETADTLAAMREAKRKGAKTVAVVNVVASSAAREADNVLYTLAGPEIAVATTKAYSAQLAAMYLIAAEAALSRGTMSEEEVRDFCRELGKLPKLVEQTLGVREQIQYLASVYSNRQNTFFIGRGVDFAAAQEASLKLKEISYVHSEAYAGGELKHGTISLIEKGTLVVAMDDDPMLHEKIVSNIQSVKARGASVVLVTCLNEEIDRSICDHVVKIPNIRSEMTASLSIIPMQLFSYYIGVCRGCDIDKPRNLAKSVTVE